VAALRCLYKRAVDDGLITEADNPAQKVAKPRRLPTTRRALPDTRLAEINEVAASTGDDPELDTLMLRLRTETACRRGGALALRLQDLDPDQCLVLLREKGETVRWQPVSPTLRAASSSTASSGMPRQTGSFCDTQTDARSPTAAMTTCGRASADACPGVATQGISTHWIRHTILTWVQGRGVASDATFRTWREDGAARDAGPGAVGWRSRPPNEPAGQDGRDRTMLRQMPGCCVHSRCIRVQHVAARATKKHSDEGRCHHRSAVTLTHSAWLVNRSLPVS
jgi:integrase/recombinase XerC